MSAEVTLRDFLVNHGKMNQNEAFKLLKPALEELAEIHNRGYIYGNVNPDNILIDSEEKTRLRDINDIPQIYKLEKAYAAPEQITANAVMASDVYGFCAVLYTCVTGSELADSTARRQNDIFLLGTEWDYRTTQILTIGLNLSADARFQTVFALKNALDKKNEIQGILPPAKNKKFSMKKGIVIIATVLSVSVFTVGTFLINHNLKDEKHDEANLTRMQKKETIETAEAGENYEQIKTTLDQPKENAEATIAMFDGFMKEETWNTVHNEAVMKEAKEKIHSDDADNPINLRYAYCYAWLIHEQVIEGMKDNSMNADRAAEFIAMSLQTADYCEFLIREAEAYAIQAGAEESDYFQPVEEIIFPDSSEREYSKEEILSCNLSMSELRAARIEIYDRHGFTQDNMYQFQSYNDFGEYSTDDKNGLSPVERHNIRTIARLEIQSINALR